MMGTVNTPRDEYTLLRRIEALERRVRELETGPRAGYTSVSTSGRLSVGDPAGDVRIELDSATSPTSPAIRLHSAGDGEAVLEGLDNGARVFAESSGIHSYPVEASIDNFAYQSRLRAQSQDSGTAAHVTAEVQDSPRRAGVTISAISTVNPSDCRIDLIADGGVAPPVLSGNPSGSGVGVLYIVGNALRYKDASGAVHTLT